MIEKSHYPACAILCAALYFVQLPVPVAAAETAPLVTPAGITLQVARTPECVAPCKRSRSGLKGGVDALGSEVKTLFNRGVTRVVYYADDHGLALYTSDKDKPRRSTCTGECTKSWMPAAARQASKPSGDWSIIRRPDGIQQWALNGKPLYRYVKDTEIGYAKGAGSEDKSWHLATFKPAAEMSGPYGVTFAEAYDTHAIVLVDATRHTLYQYVGDLKSVANNCAEAACDMQFRPVLAPQLAQSLWPDFAVVTRPDGVTQWAYKGKLLFTYDGDLYPGAVQGEHANARWRPILKNLFFVPRGVTLTMSLNQGPIWTTSSGITLYRQEALVHRLDRTSLRSDVGTPPVGRNIGTRGCLNECLKSYRPLQAPESAVPTGYWSIYVRDNGTRQWAYKGYALYTYVGDKAPGQMESADRFIYFVDDGNGTQEIPAVTQTTSTPALFWRYAEP